MTDAERLRILDWVWSHQRGEDTSNGYDIPVVDLAPLINFLMDREVPPGYSGTVAIDPEPKAEA